AFALVADKKPANEESVDKRSPHDYYDDDYYEDDYNKKKHYKRHDYYKKKDYYDDDYEDYKYKSTEIIANFRPTQVTPLYSSQSQRTYSTITHRQRHNGNFSIPPSENRNHRSSTLKRNINISLYFQDIEQQRIKRTFL
ncbi:2594_t:CDS:2, partial [Funneliformis geosporum]